jgi:nitrogen fixation protein FixH
MKVWFGMGLAIAAVALTSMLVGCGGGSNQTTPSPSQTGSGTAATGTALGTAAAAGPFQVTLTTAPAAPKVGDTRFQAQVTRDGQPVKDATVTVSLSMPSMNMGGPETTLKPTGDRYEGTANLGMGGEYQTKTTVTAGSDMGTAVFQFMATQ